MEKMNKIFIVAGLLSLSALTSCDNEKFLTTPQYTLVASDAMFENDENAKKGMSGIYDMMLPNGSDDGGYDLQHLLNC